MGEIPLDEAHLAAAAFLARYRARTLEAYRYDRRKFFQWAADSGLEVLAATRPEIELYVRTMEERGLAATTIDRRLSTVCALCRFAHIDGRIAGHRQRQQASHHPLVPRTARTIDLDLAIGERATGPILLRADGERLDRRTAHRSVRSIAKRAGLGVVHPHMLRSAFIMAALEAGVPLGTAVDRPVWDSAVGPEARLFLKQSGARRSRERVALLRRPCVRPVPGVLRHARAGGPSALSILPRQATS